MMRVGVSSLQKKSLGVVSFADALLAHHTIFPPQRLCDELKEHLQKRLHQLLIGFFFLGQCILGWSLRHCSELSVNLFFWIADCFPQPFEGCKLVINKGLSNHFQVSHTLQLSGLGPGAYHFGATYVGNKQTGPNEVLCKHHWYSLIRGFIVGQASASWLTINIPHDLAIITTTFMWPTLQKPTYFLIGKSR